MSLIKDNIKIILLVSFFSIVVTVATTYGFYYMFTNDVFSNDVTTIDDVKTLDLKDVELFHSMESKRILVLSRKTNKIDQIISEKVATVIFAIKSSEIQADYDAAISTSGTNVDKKSKK